MRRGSVRVCMLVWVCKCVCVRIHALVCVRVNSCVCVGGWVGACVGAGEGGGPVRACVVREMGVHLGVCLSVRVYVRF